MGQKLRLELTVGTTMRVESGIFIAVYPNLNNQSLDNAPPNTPGKEIVSPLLPS